MNKKDIQKKRTMLYFIDAADDIIEESNLNQITIRNVADRAGYNSATIYNYFENLDHLKLFAALRHMKPYIMALPEYVNKANTPLERFENIWKCFYLYSFKDPEIYFTIFFASQSDNLEKYIESYYTLFPEELKDISDGLNDFNDISKNLLGSMLLKGNIHDRGMSTLKDLIDENSITKENATYLNDMIIMIYKGILSDLIDDKISVDNAVIKIGNYINILINAFFN